MKGLLLFQYKATKNLVFERFDSRILLLYNPSNRKRRRLGFELIGLF
jgi:hypothetical protein